MQLQALQHTTSNSKYMLQPSCLLVLADKQLCLLHSCGCSLKDQLLMPAVPLHWAAVLPDNKTGCSLANPPSCLAVLCSLAQVT